MTPPQFDNVPQFLRDTPRWVLWRAEKRADGKVAKVPKRTDCKNASSTNPDSWCTFDEARAAYEAAPRWFSGVGLVLDGSDGLVGVDLDHCIEVDVLDGSRVYSDMALETVKAIPGYWEVSPSGEGLRGFIIAPGVVPPQKQVKDELGARECYSSGRYLTVTGDVLWDTAVQAPEPLKTWLALRMGGAAADGAIRNTASPSDIKGDGSVDDLIADSLVPGPLAEWTLERVRNELAPHLDVEGEYDEWLELGAALHHQFEGSEEGFELWEEISQRSSKYTGPEYSRPKWDSFGGAPRPVTLRTLLKRTGDARGAAEKAAAAAAAAVAASDRAAALAGMLSRVAACQDVDILKDLCQAETGLVQALDQMGSAQMTAALRTKVKLLIPGITVKDLNTAVRALTAPPTMAVAVGVAPPAFNGWVYVTQGDVFYNINQRGDAISRTAFNALMNREVPPAVAPLVKRPAADMCTDHWNIVVVSRLLYAPPFGPVFQHDGIWYANTYDPDSVPQVPAAYSPAGMAAIETIKKHVSMMLRDPREERLLLSWIAHNVQKPGVLIKWAPFIPGPAGVGKSFFSRLLRCAMGPRNVNEVNVAGIASHFKGWAAGAAVNVLDEVKLHGTNKHDVMNNLKPYITNDAVPMERKGHEPCTIPNFTNYLCLSNYLDGLPIDNGDRRYACFPSLLTKEDGEKLLHEGHFTRLFDLGIDAEGLAGEIRKWFLEFQLDPEVTGQKAPETAGKAVVIAAGEPEGVEVGRQIIAEGRIGVTEFVISSRHFTTSVAERLGHRIFGSAVSSALTALGYVRWVGSAGSPNFKWKGQCLTVYTKRGAVMTPDQMRAALDASSDPEIAVL